MKLYEKGFRRADEVVEAWHNVEPPRSGGSGSGRRRALVEECLSDGNRVTRRHLDVAAREAPAGLAYTEHEREAIFGVIRSAAERLGMVLEVRWAKVLRDAVPRLRGLAPCSGIFILAFRAFTGGWGDSPGADNHVPRLGHCSSQAGL